MTLTKELMFISIKVTGQRSRSHSEKDFFKLMIWPTSMQPMKNSLPDMLFRVACIGEKHYEVK